MYSMNTKIYVILIYMKKFLKENVVYIALVQAIVAMLGSLYFSEIRHFPPCVLCWYQRICMYPLVVIIFVGILRMDKKNYLYVLPLSIIGWCISLYHNLLYYKILPEALAPCRAGISCTTKFFAWFGFITIPLLSFIAFTVIITCMLLQMYFEKQEEKKKLVPVQVTKKNK
jgi:disulfide bond formation protein DsbB